MNAAGMANAAKGASAASGAGSSIASAAGGASASAGKALGGAESALESKATQPQAPKGVASEPTKAPGQSSTSTGNELGDKNSKGLDGEKLPQSEGEEAPKEKKIVDEQKAAHSQGEAPEGSQKGDKLGDGKEVDENGQIQDSATKKTAKAAGRVVARVYGGEAGGQAADAICASQIGDKVIGNVSDIADKTVPGLKQASEELEKAGAADGVNDALDTYEKFKNGDIAGGIESAKKVKADLKKTKKYTVKRTLQLTLIAIAPLLLILIIVAAVSGAEQGGIIDQNGNYLGDLSDEEIQENLESEDDTESGNLSVTSEQLNLTDVSDEEVIAAVSKVSGYSSFSVTRKAVIAASERAIRSNIPYLYGGKPKGPGISGIKTGIDCSGFVEWAYWTATGSKPTGSDLGTSTIIANIGTVFEEISCSQLKPGDIGLRNRGTSSSNHTGIYAGNGQWYHSPQTGQYVKKSNYNNFKVCVRYKGIDA